MIELEMRHVTLGYDHHPVMEDVTLKASPGEMVGLIGPNGSGKSTIIKALSHLIRPTAGEILVDGRDIKKIPRRELACLVGVVPQLPLLPSTFTAFEIVLMGRNPHLGCPGRLYCPPDRVICRRKLHFGVTKHRRQCYVKA